MILLHTLLGAAVVVLNGLGGVQSLLPRVQEVPPVAGWGHGALAIQLASGFFLVSGTTGGPGLPHYVLPLGALALVIAVRGAMGRARVRAVGVASLLAAGVSLFVFASGWVGG